MLVGRRFVVAGRVQGVGFRYFARAAARREGLAGSVRNLDDGRVEIVVEGDDEAVTRFERSIDRARRAHAWTASLVEPAPATGHASDFRILSS